MVGSRVALPVAFTGCLTAAVMSAIPIGGQQPEAPKAVLVIPDDEQIKVAPLGGTKREEAIRKRIEEVLRNRSATNPTSGDPMLDDLLELLRTRGSVLDGSLLDPQVPADQPRPPSDLRDERAVTSGNVLVSKSYALAEQMLKIARRLEGVGDDSGSRAALVVLLRREATRILIDEISAAESILLKP